MIQILSIGVSGGLHSPNYPFAYNHQSDCQYLIQTSAGSSLNITFLDLDLVNCIRKIPWTLKLNGNISKYILKKAFEKNF